MSFFAPLREPALRRIFENGLLNFIRHAIHVQTGFQK